MNDSGPEFSFLGLPLSAEQESEIHHYFHLRARHGLQPDLEELREMLHDMVEPPVAETMVEPAEVLGLYADAEHASSLVDERGNSISAFDERIAAREVEAMKHPAQ